MKSQPTKLFTKIATFALYALPAIFFLILYFLLVMTGEDVLHAAAYQNLPILERINDTLHSLARIGEVYQRTVMPHWTPQGEFTFTSLFWRSFDALLAWLLCFIFGSVALGRKLKFAFKDALLFLAIFCWWMVSPFSEFAMLRFSHAHNYVPFLIVLALFGFCAQKLLFSRPKLTIFNKILYFLLGFLLAFSNELIALPILAVFALSFVWHLIKNKKVVLSFGLGCLIGGLIIGYIGAGLVTGTLFGGHMNDDYTEKYQYLSPATILTGNYGENIRLLSQHLHNNVKPFAYGFILIAAILLTDFYFKQNHKNKTVTAHFAKLFTAHGYATLFILVYFAMTTLLWVEYDVYYRLMTPVFAAFVYLVFSFFINLLRQIKLDKKLLITGAIFLIIVAITMIADMSYAFGKYRLLTGKYLSKSLVELRLQSEGKTTTCVEFGDPAMAEFVPSPIFAFTAFRYFENITVFNSYQIYDMQMIYSETKPCPPAQMVN